METIDDLKEFIRRVPNFPKDGIIFRDISPLLAEPSALTTVTNIFSDHWEGEIDVIIGLDARGFIFASLLASKMQLPFVMIRKKGKLPGETISVDYSLEYGTATVEMQKDAIKPGARVLVVDDLLATGGTALAACELIQKVGALVAGCAFVIELDELGGAEKLKEFEVQSILHYNNENDPVYTADCIAKNEEGKYVFINRLTYPKGLALIGGKKEGEETPEQTILREVGEEVNLELTIEGELGVYDKPDRDPRGTYISTVLIGRVKGIPKGEKGKTEVVILTEEELLAKTSGDFAFDHHQMVQDYLVLTAHSN